MGPNGLGHGFYERSADLTSPKIWDFFDLRLVTATRPT